MKEIQLLILIFKFHAISIWIFLHSIEISWTLCIQSISEAEPGSLSKSR